MGMFDYVIVECPIDGIPDPSAIEWQTKEFDVPFLEKYKITADGRLLHEKVHYEDRSDPSAESGTFASFYGAMTPVSDGWEELAHHGDVEFIGEVDGEFLRFTARFHDGRLDRIVASRESTGTRVETSRSSPNETSLTSVPREEGR